MFYTCYESKLHRNISCILLFSLSSAIYFQEEIIPENYRQKVAEEEKAKEMEDLYLPPRSRKTLQQINQSESDGKIFLLSFYYSRCLNK